jgi:hypothetical protein
MPVHQGQVAIVMHQFKDGLATSEKITHPVELAVVLADADACPSLGLGCPVGKMANKGQQCNVLSTEVAMENCDAKIGTATTRGHMST